MFSAALTLSGRLISHFAHRVWRWDGDVRQWSCGLVRFGGGLLGFPGHTKMTNISADSELAR